MKKLIVMVVCIGMNAGSAAHADSYKGRIYDGYIRQSVNSKETMVFIQITPCDHPKKTGWSVQELQFKGVEIPIGLDFLRREGEVVGVYTTSNGETQIYLDRKEECTGK